MSGMVGSWHGRCDVLYWGWCLTHLGPIGKLLRITEALYITLVLPYVPRSFNNPNNGVNQELPDQGH